MYITITISELQIARVQESFKRMTGAPAPQDTLVEFFQQDVEALYYQYVGEDLDEAVSSFFYIVE